MVLPDGGLLCPAAVASATHASSMLKTDSVMDASTTWPAPPLPSALLADLAFGCWRGGCGRCGSGGHQLRGVVQPARLRFNRTQQAARLQDPPPFPTHTHIYSHPKPPVTCAYAAAPSLHQRLRAVQPGCHPVRCWGALVAWWVDGWWCRWLAVQMVRVDGWSGCVKSSQASREKEHEHRFPCSACSVDTHRVASLTHGPVWIPVDVPEAPKRFTHRRVARLRCFGTFGIVHSGGGDGGVEVGGCQGDARVLQGSAGGARCSPCSSATPPLPPHRYPTTTPPKPKPRHAPVCPYPLMRV